MKPKKVPLWTGVSLPPTNTRNMAAAVLPLPPTNTPEQHRPAKSPNPPRMPPHKKKARVTNTAPRVCEAPYFS